MTPTPPHQHDAAVRAFVRRTFGLRGTLRLHRAALGTDLLRAPINVALAPVFVLIRLAALMVRLCRLRRMAQWLATRQIHLETNVARRVSAEVTALLTTLHTNHDLQLPAPAQIRQAVADYAAVRTAIAEITTTCIVLVAGYIVFSAATPGVISLAAPVAEMQAHQRAVDGFWLGQRLGSAYYGVFSTRLTFAQILLTGVVLAMIASIFTAFAGVIADPIQVATGTHRRRLNRLIDRLANTPDAPGGLASEHVAARSADIADIALNLWRSLRG